MQRAITFRPARAEDAAFLYGVYASTRTDELAPLQWDEARQAAFLTMQFTAQDRHYKAHYADAEFLVVLVGGHPAGRLYVARRADAIHLIDLALLPEYRGLGIGTRILHALLDEALQARKPVYLHVESMNPARRLYERLGFSAISDNGIYWLMGWVPPSSD